MNELDGLTPSQVDELIVEQARQPRIPAACGGVVWYDERPTWPELGIEIDGTWISNRAGDARWEMIPESELINYRITDEQVEELWIQAGCEWHHVKRLGLILKERFFRRAQVERFGRIYYM